jgi:PAS domain S-box-containing protein
LENKLIEENASEPRDGREEPKINRDRYRVFIEDAADAFYETDIKGHFRFFNDALCRIFGYSKGEIQDRNYCEFMDEKNARIAFESFNEIYRTEKKITDIKWEITRKDGEARILEISANLIVDDNGQKIGFRGIARDVTEKYLAQQALKESEQHAHNQYLASRRAERRYRALLDFLPDPLFVFNLDSTVSYLNPAFVEVFGWSLEELEGKHIPFVPDFLKEETRQGTQRLFKEKVIHRLETKRLTKDGRMLDIVIDGAIFYEEENEPAGQVVILRDVTREKRVARSNQALFRIAKALPLYQRLDELLEFIIKEVQDLISAEGALVILLDEEKKEFFIPVATFDDTETGKKMKEVRFPVDKGIAGHVYRTGKPLIVPDTFKSPYFYKQVDEQSGYHTRSLLDVPIQTQDRMIGVLCAVNKKEGEFDREDIDLLSTIASTVALPIENARINEKLKLSYEDVKSLNRAKERVIHHLSHELKTPVSVLSASLGLLNKKLSGLKGESLKRILDRAQRSLNRILDMQYEIEDILRERDYKTYRMLSALLEACVDELEVLVSEEAGEGNFVQRIRQRVEELFGPRDSLSQEIRLDRFVEEKIQTFRPRFAHRQCRLTSRVESVPPILIPPDVLAKIVEGLIRNAVENTPDGGRIEVTVRNGRTGPEFEVKDFGVGITEDNQRLIFESIFSTSETMQYSTRKPYDFNAGGRGFDLLRMKIFSERYNFKIRMISKRCSFIPRNEDLCPGKIEICDHCRTIKDCLHSGGTTMIVQFHPADWFSSKEKSSKG